MLQWQQVSYYPIYSNNLTGIYFMSLAVKQVASFLASHTCTTGSVRNILIAIRLILFQSALQLPVSRNLLHDLSSHLRQHVNFCLVKFEGNYRICSNLYFIVIDLEVLFLVKSV